MAGVRTEKGTGFRQQAIELAQLMRGTWPAPGWYERDRKEPTVTGAMFGLLTRLGEPNLVEGMLDRIAEDQSHAAVDNAAIVDAAELLDDEVAVAKLASIVKAHGHDALAASAALVREALKSAFAKSPQRLRSALEELIAALPGDPDKAPKDQWGRSGQVAPDTASLVDLEWLVLPPILLGQFAILDEQVERMPIPVPAALTLWAQVSADVDRRLSTELDRPIRLRPDEWASGDNLWLVDIIGEPSANQEMLRQLVQGPLSGRTVKARVANAGDNIIVTTIDPAQFV